MFARKKSPQILKKKNVFADFFFQCQFQIDFFLNRHGHAKFSGVFGGVIKIYVIQLELYLCSQKGGKNYFSLYQKKLRPFFLNINPNSMILRHEIDPVFFLRVVSNLPRFLSGIR